MSALDDLLRPVIWIDREIVHRAYNDVASCLENRGISRNTAARGLAMLPSLTLMAVSISTEGQSDSDPSVVEMVSEWGLAALWSGNYALDFIHTLRGGGEGGVSDGEISIDKFDSQYNGIQRACRLPILTVAAWSLYETVQFALARGYSDETIYAGGGAIIFASLASSMYMKDTDTKMPDREPLWERAYSWLKSKASNLAPKPALVPVVVPRPD